jgi:hypothetical protein
MPDWVAKELKIEKESELKGLHDIQYTSET